MRRFDLKSKEIARWNQITQDGPRPRSFATRLSAVYSVRSGDTMDRIAPCCGIDLQNLLLWNDPDMAEITIQITTQDASLH